MSFINDKRETQSHLTFHEFKSLKITDTWQLNLLWDAAVDTQIINGPWLKQFKAYGDSDHIRDLPAKDLIPSERNVVKKMTVKL